MNPRNFPAVAGYIINMILSAFLAFKIGSASLDQAVATAVVALVSLVVAFTVHPFVVAAAAGAFQTFAVALGAFGFHLNDQQLAITVTIFGFIAAIVTHTQASPLAAVRQGVTGYELDRRRYGPGRRA